jgi:hypothetical protein
LGGRLDEGKMTDKQDPIAENEDVIKCRWCGSFESKNWVNPERKGRVYGPFCSKECYRAYDGKYWNKPAFVVGLVLIILGVAIPLSFMDSAIRLKLSLLLLGLIICCASFFCVPSSEESYPKRTPFSPETEPNTS